MQCNCWLHWITIIQGRTTFNSQHWHTTHRAIKSIDIWDSHIGEDVDVGLLTCDAMYTCRKIPTFRETYCLHLQGSSVLSASPHGITLQKTNISNKDNQLKNHYANIRCLTPTSVTLDSLQRKCQVSTWSVFY